MSVVSATPLSAGHIVGVERVTVAISDFGVCTDRRSWLCTYALGSCIAMLLYEPRRHVGGLLHFMLPDSGLNPEKARARPGMFADTGFQQLSEALLQQGTRLSDMRASLIGGGSLQGLHLHMNIGRDNTEAARALLAASRTPIVSEDVGGNRSRSAFLHIGTGQVVARGPHGEYEL